MNISVQSGGIIENIGAKKCYSLIAKAGFSGIDWNGPDHACPFSVITDGKARKENIFLRSTDEIYNYFKPELDEIFGNGLVISQAHAPFPAYVAGGDMLDDMIGIYKGVIRLCDRVGCKRLVIHGISLALNDNINTSESIKALNFKLYESLIPTLLECDVTVCLENLFTSGGGPVVEGFCANPEEAVFYIDSLNEKAGKEVFGFCIDTGHMRLLRKDFRSFVPLLGKRIKCLHIHDNDGNSDAHLAPMAGKINWTHFTESLRAAGYDGDLSFETFRQAEAALSVGEDMLFTALEYIYGIGKAFREQIEK